MNKYQLVTSAIATILFLVLPNYAVADGDPVYFYPYQTIIPDIKVDTMVEMRDEVVTFDIKEGGACWGKSSSKGDYAKVTAVFNMFNSGERDEKLGVIFPLLSPDELEDIDTNFSKYYKVYVDEIEIPTRKLEKFYGDNKIPVIYWEETFPANKFQNIKITYIVETDCRMQSFNYILQTGANWHGVIGKGNIIFNFPIEINDTEYDNDVPIVPGCKNIGENNLKCNQHGNVLELSFDNFEPTKEDDIDINFESIKKIKTARELKRQIEDNPGSKELNIEYSSYAWVYKEQGIDYFLKAIELGKNDLVFLENAGKAFCFGDNTALSSNDFECLKLRNNEPCNENISDDRNVCDALCSYDFFIYFSKCEKMPLSSGSNYGDNENNLNIGLRSLAEAILQNDPDNENALFVKAYLDAMHRVTENINNERIEQNNIQNDTEIGNKAENTNNASESAEHENNSKDNQALSNKSSSNIDKTETGTKERYDHNLLIILLILIVIIAVLLIIKRGVTKNK